MSETRVTYLIGAGASANALPVVNGMNDRMKCFFDELIKLNEVYEYNFDNELHEIGRILNKIRTHQTIDTYAKKLYLKEDVKNYNLLKRFLSCYLIFEQANKDNILDFNNDIRVKSLISKSIIPQKVDERLNDKINLQLDTRYDSFFASLLNKNKLLDPNINIITWNYDMQFELAYSDFNFDKYKVERIQDYLQIFPTAINQEVDLNKSSIIKLNGTCNFLNDRNTSTFDIINENFYDNRFTSALLRILSDVNHNVITQLEFAWENDRQTTKAREYAHQVIGNSDIIVIIGYSFPTFNREVDRFIFNKFDDSQLFRTYTDIVNREPESKIKQVKKIYIQDTPQNAPKIKERLKAIGNNLFDVAEIYDDVDQFLIPYEL